MIYKSLISSILIGLIFCSCNKTSKSSNDSDVIIDEYPMFRNVEINISEEKDESMHSLMTDNLLNINLDSALFYLDTFPRKWERFSIENNDTVYYKFCNAMNPQVSIDSIFKQIEIIIGNELWDTYDITRIEVNDSLLFLTVDKKNDGISRIRFSWLNVENKTGIWQFYDNNSSPFKFMDSMMLHERYNLIEEDCSGEEGA